MKILGIGVDIVTNKRIKILAKNKLFIKRTFGNDEISLSDFFVIVSVIGFDSFPEVLSISLYKL